MSNEVKRKGRETGKSSDHGLALADGETVIHDLHPAWTNYTNQIIIGVLTIWLLIGIIPLAQAYFSRKFNRIIITNERIIFLERSWTGSRSTTEFELANVERTDTNQTFLESRYDVGTVTVHMRHRHHEAERFEVTIPSIPDYREVALTLRTDAEQ